MSTRFFGTLLLALCVFASNADATLRIYFLRHAQAGHNVVKFWQDKPRAEWPAYVGREDLFTPEGEGQVATVEAKLRGLRFDLIACSPLWRTRHTILPYLRAEGRTAELWPELEEFDFHAEPPPLPPPGVHVLDGGPAMEVPADEARFFPFREGTKNRIAIAREKKQAAADAEALMAHTIQMLRTRFGGSDRSILLVGHGGNGSVLLKKLVRDTSLPWPKNASLWMIEEQADGSFRVMIANGEPVR